MARCVDRWVDRLFPRVSESSFSCVCSGNICMCILFRDVICVLHLQFLGARIMASFWGITVVNSLGDNSNTKTLCVLHPRINHMNFDEKENQELGEST